MDLNISWVEKKTQGSRNKNLKDALLSIGTVKSGKDKKGNIRYAANVSIYRKALNQFRLVKGDKISIGFDATAGLIVFKRTNENIGYTLTTNNNTESYLNFSFSAEEYPFALHSKIYIGKDDVIEENGLIIVDINSYGLKIK